MRSHGPTFWLAIATGVVIGDLLAYWAGLPPPWLWIVGYVGGTSGIIVRLEPWRGEL